MPSSGPAAESAPATAKGEPDTSHLLVLVPAAPAAKDVPGSDVRGATIQRKRSKGIILAAAAGVILLGISAMLALQPGSRTDPNAERARNETANGTPSSSEPEPSNTVQSKPTEPLTRPSFHCPGDGFADEQTICSNSGLASMERRMQDTYRNLARRQPNRHVPAEVRAFAQAALAKRHACEANVQCIMEILLSERLYFQSYGTPN